MSYKAKSSVYFVCFLIAAIAYHGSNNIGSSVGQNNESLANTEADQAMDSKVFQIFTLRYYHIFYVSILSAQPLGCVFLCLIGLLNESQSLVGD
jgi:hypothetical protein